MATIVNSIVNSEATIAVHNGVFHADDVLCVALMEIVNNKEYDVIRTRKPALLDQAKYVFDVGGNDAISDDKISFDHHSDDLIVTWDNGVKKAACAKVAEWLLTDRPELLEKLEEELIMPVSAQDNGQSLSDFGFFGSPLSFVHHMNPSLSEGADVDSLFIQAVDMAKVVVSHIIKVIEEAAEAQFKLEKTIDELPNAKFIVLPYGGMPWQKTVIEANSAGAQIDYVVYKSLGGEFMVQCVPPELGSFEKRKALPAEWGGKRGDELATISGVEGAVFCHPGLFLCGWSTKEQAIEVAEMLTK